MSQRNYQGWLIVGLVLCPLVVLGQGPVPNVFTAGTPISSAQVNANFASLDQRTAGLETKLASVQFVTAQDVASADTLDTSNYSVYVACPASSRPIGGGCSLFQSPERSVDWEFNSPGLTTGCPGALAAYNAPAGGMSRMCLRTGNEKIGGPISDGNGGAMTVASLGWKCSTTKPAAFSAVKAYVTCLQNP
jgi:hypothetical protein